MDVPAGVQFEGGNAPVGEPVRQSQPAWTLCSRHDPESEAELQELKQRLYNSYPDWQKQGQIVTGSPKTLVKKLRHIFEVLRPGIFSFWLDGPVPLKDRRTCVKLLGEEVVPALREIAKEMGLTSPFEMKPGTRP